MTAAPYGPGSPLISLKPRSTIVDKFAIGRGDIALGDFNWNPPPLPVTRDSGVLLYPTLMFVQGDKKLSCWLAGLAPDLLLNFFYVHFSWLGVQGCS